MSLNSLNSIKLVSGQNYKLNAAKLAYLDASGDYFLINGKTNTSFTSTHSTYSGLSMTILSGNTRWDSAEPTAYSCYYYDTDADNAFDSGEQLGFTFNGNSLAETDTLTINGLTQSATHYHYVLAALNDVSTKTIYFNFFDSSGNNMNTDMGFVTDPYTESVPCALPDNQSIYIIQIPQNALLSSMTIQFVGAFGNSFGISPVGILSSTIDFESTNFPCFLDGTMILTPTGEVNISALKSGDKLLNEQNEIVTVEHVWVRDVLNVKSNKENAYPNLIPKDYIDCDKPNRDLFISPQHKILYKNVMIDSKFLDVKQQFIELPFRYYNVTLKEGYGTMIANGCVVETYKRKANVSIQNEKGMVLYR